MFVHMPSRLQSKLDPKAEKCVFINYSPSKKGYEFYNPQIKKKNCDYKCLIYGSRPYFGLNCLQRQIKNNEAQFWETTIHLPNTFFLVPVLDLSTYNSQEISSHNNKKMEKLAYH